MTYRKRSIYLSNISVEEAQEKYLTQLGNVCKHHGSETIEVIHSLGRVTKEAVFAKISSPNYNASAMDGIGVKASNTFEATEANPLRLRKGEDFIILDTGDVIKDPYDAVIMIEDVIQINEDEVEILKPAFPWQHIRPVGEDIVAHEMIIPSAHKIRAVDLGAILSGGITHIEVIKKPRVGIIPTGTEMVEPCNQLQEGNIIESNSRVFEALVKEHGGKPNRYNIVVDDYEQLKQATLLALKENDLVIINAGSSAGTEDYTVHLIQELGEVVVHGIATKPGKPTILGIIEGKPVIGIPGYPVSSYFVFETFVAWLIKKYLDQPVYSKSQTQAVLAKRIVSSLKYEEYVRIKLGQVGEKLIATPLNRGAGATMSLVRADGVVVIPQSSEGVEAGEYVEVKLLKEINDIMHTLVSIGSHDLIMDIIGDLMHGANFHYNLSSSHVGSLGGIMAMKRQEAHISPIHLLDTQTGAYNMSYMKRYLGEDMLLIKGVKRVQGLMIHRENPLGINKIEDIIKQGVQFVNRQKGSGTRILTDYLLEKANISVNQIIGYEREMTTHMAVAAAVASGSAHVGIGVYSAAKALGLGFIEIGYEDYDFVVPAKYIDDSRVELFLDILRSQDLKDKLNEIGGYDASETGVIMS